MENMWDWVSSFWNKATPLDESYILPPGELESIDGKGKITQMGPEYGLIDGKFSMDLSDIGMNSLKVGDIVNYSASRPAPNREWVISSVSSIDNRRVRTGIRLYNGKAKIHDEQLLVSVISHSSLNSFKPDDLISVEFGPEDEIINIEPLRSRSKRVGVVTAYNQDLMKGKIDEQVYFSGEVTLIKGYSLFQVGDYVEYEAIERKGILPWRATQMVLTLPQTHKSIKKSKGPNNSHTKELFKSKKGVSLSGESFDFGDVHFEETSSKSIDIQNNSLRDISVTKVTISGRIGSAQFSTDFKAPQTICKSTLLSLNINCSAVNIGKIKVLIIVELEDKNEIFTLGAHLLSNVLPPSQSLNESIKKCQLKSFKSLSVLPGRRLQRKDCGLNKSWFYKLKSYPIPETLKIEPIKVRKYLKKGTPVGLNDFLMKFRTLLFIEEISVFENMEKTALTGIRMHLVGEYLEMNIGEDLSLFPSLYEGDEVKVSPDNDEYDYQGFIHCIKGSIVYIQFDPSFHKSYSGAPCSVKFIKSRTPYRIMHRSVEIAEEYLGPEILFPSEIRLRKPLIHVSEDVKIFKREPTPILNKKQQIYPKKISVADKLGSSFKSLESDNFVVPIYSLNLQQRLSIKGKAKSPSKLPHHFSPNTKSKEKNGEKKVPAYVPNVVPFKKGNSCIEWTQPYLNPEQKQAVRSILKGEARPIPYIIFGPPGTGKTVTLLETILQIFILRKDSRILVTAPSNAACDLLLNLLAASKKVKPGDVVRILGARRKFENIPEYLIPYYFSIKNEKETMEGVLKSRIVVTTCTSSSFFSRIKDFRRFTHVFVDEAGFVLEPDILTPLNFVDIEEGQIVLAGDEKQLSPVLSSSLAKEFGLAYSLIERLCSFNPLYAPDPNKFVTRFSDSYDSLLITKLVRNYRNHPAILKLPSKLFYHDELIPSVSNNQSFKGYDILLNEDFPIVFHALDGEQRRDEDSPSWYNYQEAFQIVLYLRKLYSIPRISEDQVGIITPYRKQVDCIKSYIQSFDLPIPKVGSVEEFQGQERLIILLSTVRSSTLDTPASTKHVLGFVGDEKRFNVALTRAKDLLIIVGNPKVLIQDSVWKEFIEYCDRNHVIDGCEFTFKEEQES
uniref:RNA helicase n=1 Tax=Lepeophtheirus salmonis TaxID=72036 RepID=A0A0K2TFB5_LEPSM